MQAKETTAAPSITYFPAWRRVADRTVTAIFIAAPPLVVVIAIPLLWGRVVHLRDLVIGLVLYAVTGHGITVGFHRLFAHRSFTAARPLKVVLAIAGSMAVEGSLIGWVANHRRHHVFSDRDGDPHSPHVGARGGMSAARGLFHAHFGWLFAGEEAAASRYAPDLLRDRDLVVLSRLFPVFAIASLGLPLLAGWLLSGGSWRAGLTAFLWAGVVRVGLIHHATWSINSICHTFGRRPHDTGDHSTNVAALAIVTMGESWHNSHHAAPACARHGIGPGQLDSSARLIRLFELAGWATAVRWPVADRESVLAA